MKPSFKFSIALTALCACTLGWVLRQSQPVVHASPAIQSAYIKSVPIEGEDILKLLQLKARKFEFALPVRQKCSLEVWVESWNRNSTKPVIHGLLGIGLLADDKHTLMVKLPKDGADDFVLASDGATAAGHLPALAAILDGSSQTLDHEPLSFDKDITLMVVVRNKSNEYMFDYKTPGYEKRNDHVAYLKLRFTKIMNASSPKWQNGHVVFRL